MKFTWSDPLTEDQAKKMLSRTLFQNVWLEGDKVAYLMYASIDEDPVVPEGMQYEPGTITLSIKAIAHSEVEQLEESCVYITTKKCHNVDFPVYCAPADEDEMRLSWPEETN